MVSVRLLSVAGLVCGFETPDPSHLCIHRADTFLPPVPSTTRSRRTVPKRGESCIDLNQFDTPVSWQGFGVLLSAGPVPPRVVVDVSSPGARYPKSVQWEGRADIVARTS